ncbi:MAG: flavin monoamine oxidase family protein [Pseudohaliea sp.]
MVLSRLSAAVLALLLSACRIEVIVPEGARVLTESGAFRCAGPGTCELEVSDLFFDETFFVETDPDSVFRGWKKRHRGLCGGRSDRCRLFTSGFEGNEALMAILDSDEVFFLEAEVAPPATAHDVIVVGAGSAGLYATKFLQEHGYDVLLIEATDRIGGRVKSASLGDTRVDLGAEEHYLGTGGNPVWPAVRARYGEAIYVRPYRGIDANSMDGGSNTCWTTPSAARPCSVDADVTAVRAFWDWYWRPNLHQDPSATLADAVLAEFGVGPGHRAYHLYDAGIAGGVFATSLHRLGARSLALQSVGWDLSSSVRVLRDKDLGYADALETLWWDEVVANSDLLLEHPVVRIDTSGEDVLVTDERGGRHWARQVIVTVSVGVLQAETIDFVPDLPSATVAAYNGIGMGPGLKVALRFRSAWWETEGEALGWLVTEGLAGACWAPGDYKVGSEAPILMCYPMGDNGAALSELAEDAGGGAAGDRAIVDAILADLDRTFPGAPGRASATYRDALVQNWGADPYIRGVYSFPLVGTYASADDNRRLDLQQPAAANRLFFAGEASHPTHPGTVVGALHEGERAARAVHAVNGNPGRPPALPD